MNRLANALAFAVVVITAFVMESNLPRKVASSPLVARVVHQFRGESLPVMGSLEGLPRVDGAELDRVLAESQAARQVLVRAEMQRAAERVRVKVERSASCKVVKIDQ